MGARRPPVAHPNSVCIVSACASRSMRTAPRPRRPAPVAGARGTDRRGPRSSTTGAETHLDGVRVGAIANNRSHHGDVWFSCWFNALRASYGPFHYGQLLARDDWVGKAGARPGFPDEAFSSCDDAPTFADVLAGRPEQMTTAQTVARGTQKGSHWNGQRLVVRGDRWPVAAPFLLMAAPQLLFLALFVILWVFTLDTSLMDTGPGVDAGIRQDQMGQLIVLGVVVVVFVAVITVELTIAFSTPRTTARLAPDGVLATIDYRPDFWVPWEAVRRISVHRSRLLISVAPTYWEYLGRRPLPGWLPAIAVRRSVAPALLPGSGASDLIMVPMRGSGMTAEEILWCARQVAPAAVEVGQARTA